MRIGKVVGYFALMLLPGFLSAQPKGFQPLKNTEAFRQSLAKSNASVQTISSDFTQVKNLSMLAEKIKSKGKFYFKKEDKARIEYTSPFSYLLVMNGGQLLVKDEQKTSKVNTKNSKTMQSVNRIMIDCMKGTVFQNPDFNTSSYESQDAYLLSMAPVTETMKKMFRQIDVFMGKKGLDVQRVVMTEQGGDLTEMSFTNTLHNIALNDALFKVK